MSKKERERIEDNRTEIIRRSNELGKQIGKLKLELFNAKGKNTTLERTVFKLKGRVDVKDWMLIVVGLILFAIGCFSETALSIMQFRYSEGFGPIHGIMLIGGFIVVLMGCIGNELKPWRGVILWGKNRKEFIKGTLMRQGSFWNMVNRKGKDNG